MSVILAFFLFILLFVVVIVVSVVVRVVRAAQRMKQNLRSMFGNTDAPSGNAHGQQHQHQPPRRRKKIDPSVGEYVKFEEIACTVTHTDKTVTYTREQQIVDVEWEDL